MTQIRIVGDRGVAQVGLDGHDISPALRGVTLRLDAREIPTATLDVVVYQGVSVEVSNARVSIPTETAALLRHLGWSHPDYPAPEDTR